MKQLTCMCSRSNLRAMQKVSAVVKLRDHMRSCDMRGYVKFHRGPSEGIDQ